MKKATLQDIELYPELNLVEGQEFDPPATEPLNEGTTNEGTPNEGDPGSDEGDPPPGGNNPDKKPIIP